MNPAWCSPTAEGVRISVQLAPNARQNEICGIHDGALKIRLQAQPIEGRANEALLRFLADRLGVAKSAVTLLHGHTSKRKVVSVSAPLSVADVEARLAGA